MGEPRFKIINFDGEHIRSASYLLQYRTSSSSFIARPLAPPVLVDLDQVSTSDMATKKR